MDEDTIATIALIREQYYILAIVNNKGSWLLYDKNPCSLDTLAMCLKTDEWDNYRNGVYKVYDKDNNLITDCESEIDWHAIQPIHFIK